MSRTFIFIVVSALLLVADHQLQRHGIVSPRWLLPALWVALALWSRIDDGELDPRAQRVFRRVVLPVAGTVALVLGVVGWSMHESGLFGIAALALLPGGVALLLRWAVELFRGDAD